MSPGREGNASRAAGASPGGTAFTASQLEENLARVYQLTRRRNLGIISASRRRLSPAQNAVRARLLEADIRASRRFGFCIIAGTFRQMGVRRPKMLEERAYLVLGGTNDFRDLRKQLIAWGAKYDQDAVAVKRWDENEGYLIGTKLGISPGLGSMVPIGSWHPSRMGELYAAMKGGSARASLVFESLAFLRPRSFFTRVESPL